MRDGDSVKLALRVPSAWNVGPIPVGGEPEILPAPRAELRLYASWRPGRDDEAYRETGKQEALAIIWRDDEIVCFFTRNELANIVAEWDRLIRSLEEGPPVAGDPPVTLSPDDEPPGGSS